VTFGKSGPSCALTRKDLMTLPILSEIEPLDDLVTRGQPGLVNVDGRPICPVPLAYHPSMNDALNIEADMTGGEGGWSLKPLDGPSAEWPRDFLALLRRIRGVKGMIQAREMREMDGSQTTSPAPRTS
jgi:hypothetical protein